MKHLFLFLVMVVSCAACPVGWNVADLNNDCRVDLADFAILAENWLKEYNMAPEQLKIEGTLTPEGASGVILTKLLGEHNGKEHWGFNTEGDPVFATIQWSTIDGTWRYQYNVEVEHFPGLYKGFGWIGGEEVIGDYEAVLPATGTATVTEYISETAPSHPIEINSIVCTDAFIIENSLTGVDNSIF